MNQDLQKALDSMPGAKQTNVTEGMTSAGRLDKMLGSDSPLMKRASTQGLQLANSRGLLNSSMAAGASQGAMIDRAQPFAMQDSNNLISTAQRNTEAQNQRGLLQAGLIGDSYKSNQNYEQQMGLNEQAYGFEGKLAEQRQGYQQDNMQLADSIQQKQMELSQALEQGNMQLANQLQKDINAQQDELQRGQMQLGSQLNQAEAEQRQGYQQDNMQLADSIQQKQMELSQALEQGNMQLANKLQQEINTQQQGFQQDNMKLGDSIQQNQMKLSQALEQGNMQLANQLQEQINAQQQQFQQDNMKLGNQFEQGLINQQADIQKGRDERLAGFDKEMQRLGAELAEARAQGDFGREKQLMDQQAGITSQRDAALFDQQVDLQARQYGLQSEMLKQETDAAMEKLFGSSMANAWGAMGNNITSTVARSMDAVNRIQLDPNISAENKTELINQITEMRDADINFQKNLFDTLPSQLKSTGVFPPAGGDSFNQARLNQIYQQTMGRDADQAGADYWRQQFDQLGWDGIEYNIRQQSGSQGGGQQTQQPSAPTPSQPAAPSGGGSTQASGGQATFADAKASLAAAGKPTDTNSVLSFMSQVNSGQASLGNTQSPPPAPSGGNNNQAANPNQSRLNQIYRQVMGRDADQAGADYWLSQLDTLGWDGIEWNIRQGSN